MSLSPLQQLYVDVCTRTDIRGDDSHKLQPSRSVLHDVLPHIESSSSSSGEPVAIDLSKNVVGDAGAVALFSTLTEFNKQLRIYAVLCPQSDLRLAGIQSLCRFLLSSNGSLVHSLDLRWNEFVSFRAGSALLSAIHERRERGSKMASLQLEGTNVPPHYLRRLCRCVTHVDVAT